MVSFLWPQTWLLYLASGVLGAGAALIWYFHLFEFLDLFDD